MRFDYSEQTWTPEELDILTLIEPLACVQHAYKRLPETLTIASACVFGGGPIGSLHLIELQKRFPDAKLHLIDPSDARRNLCKQIFPQVSSLQTVSNEKFDLTIVATSDPMANLSAIAATKEMGIVIHFSGLNHKTTSDLVQFEGVDLEKVHRNEEIRVLNSGVRLIGSSGYSFADILRSIESLQEDPEIYSVIQTGVVEGIGSRTLHRKDGGVQTYNETVAEAHLRSDDEYLNDLKVIFRVQDDGLPLQISPARSERRLKAAVLPQKIKAKIPDGHVRLQILRFSICNTDRRVLDGTKSAVVTDNLILGHEGIGYIEGVGAGVDEAVLFQGLSLVLPHYYHHDDPLLQKGTPYLSLGLRHLGIHLDGCFANYIDVPAQCAFPIEPVLTSGTIGLASAEVA